MGPVAAHILIIHTVSEKGGKPKKYQNLNGKIQRTNTNKYKTTIKNNVIEKSKEEQKYIPDKI